MTLEGTVAFSGATFDLISEDAYLRDQSWYYACVVRTGSGATRVEIRRYAYEDQSYAIRVEIRRNAHEDQSYAKVSMWLGDGWTTYDWYPTPEWWAEGPSYMKDVLSREDWTLFVQVRDTLLKRLARGLWGSKGEVVRVKA